MRRISLVTMPFASARRPSLQLGLLKGMAQRVGWTASTHHFNLDFAALIGLAKYEFLCQHRGIQLGDWLFTSVAFPDAGLQGEAAFIDGLPQELLRDMEAAGFPDASAWLARTRQEVVPAFLRAAVMSLLRGNPDAVGFTSTFQQNVASFALAKELKDVAPRIVTIFGGANFDSPMGLEWVRSIPAVEVAVIGEGDVAFPALLTAIERGEPPQSIPGVAIRSEEGTVQYTPQALPFRELDDSPMPDYDEYFERAERLGLLGETEIRDVDLPIEGSRGCWWGEKQHCIFCGLNGNTMQFRSKSPARFLEEITFLMRRHKTFRAECVDNILNMEFFQSVLPRMRDLRCDWNVFFEVKSNLTREHVRLLAGAGVKRIQPGIESLSSSILRTMRKGVRAIQNVNLLRWCRAYNIDASWNLLWGFPGESIQDYRDQLAVISAIPHLQPPASQGRLWLERFSPMFLESHRYGIREVNPEPSYKAVYPNDVDLTRSAYFFNYVVDGALPPESFSSIVESLDAWRARWKSGSRPLLSCMSVPGLVRLVDSRDASRSGVYELEAELASIYMAFFEKPTGLSEAARTLGLPGERVEEAVEVFAEQGLMMREGNAALALAVGDTSYVSAV